MLHCNNSDHSERSSGRASVRKTLILHIGMHKTGSSAVQHFFSRNRALLRSLGVFYPKSIGPDGRRQPKHNALFTAISHEADDGAPHPMLGCSESLVQRLIEEISTSKAQTAVVSAEGFSGEKPAFAKALQPLGAEFDVRIVCFLRRPDEWVERFYRQMVLSRDVRETRPISEFLDDPATRLHLNYPLILSWWADAFGPTALRLGPYDDMAASSVMRQFLSLAGLPKWLGRLPHARARRNASATDHAVLARLSENRGDAGAASTEEIFLSETQKAELMIRLKVDWGATDRASQNLMMMNPFIPSMLEASGASWCVAP